MNDEGLVAHAHVTGERDYHCAHCGLVARPSVIGVGTSHRDDRRQVDAPTRRRLALALAEKDARLSARLARCPRCGKRSFAALLSAASLAAWGACTVVTFFLALGAQWSWANGCAPAENLGGFGILAALAGPLVFAWGFGRQLLRSKRNVVF